jgi:mRNA interferase MazF
VILRGDVWWVDLEEPRGSAPGCRRPVLVVQSDAFTRSRIGTVIAVTLTSNLRLADAPGNVFVPMRSAGLSKDSVINVSQVVTLDRADFTERAGQLPGDVMRQVDRGIRLVLDL